jgi:hypothetical protein
MVEDDVDFLNRFCDSKIKKILMKDVSPELRYSNYCNDALFARNIRKIKLSVLLKIPNTFRIPTKSI